MHLGYKCISSNPATASRTAFRAHPLTLSAEYFFSVLAVKHQRKIPRCAENVRHDGYFFEHYAEFHNKHGVSFDKQKQTKCLSSTLDSYALGFAAVITRRTKELWETSTRRRQH